MFASALLPLFRLPLPHFSFLARSRARVRDAHTPSATYTRVDVQHGVLHLFAFFLCVLMCVCVLMFAPAPQTRSRKKKKRSVSVWARRRVPLVEFGHVTVSPPPPLSAPSSFTCSVSILEVSFFRVSCGVRRGRLRRRLHFCSPPPSVPLLPPPLTLPALFFFLCGSSCSLPPLKPHPIASSFIYVFLSFTVELRLRGHASLTRVGAVAVNGLLRGEWGGARRSFSWTPPCPL